MIAKNPITSYSSKLAAVFFAALLLVNGYSSVLYFRFSMIPNFTFNNTIYKFLYPLLIFAGILSVAIFPFLWHLRERKGNINTQKLRNVLFTIIRYWLALEISGYGFGKIFHQQFAESFIRNDTPAGNLSGYGLTWNYFGHSYVLSCIIGTIQVVGSILLLFRRTTLLGILFLLPILSTIVLIDIFYQIPIPATLNAIIFTVTLCYLLSLYWQNIKPILFLPLHRAINAQRFSHRIIRALIIGSSLVFVVYVSQYVLKKPAIAGKWYVVQKTINNVKVDPNSWLTDSTTWKSIYIEPYKKIALCPNPFVFEETRTATGEYSIKKNQDSLELVLSKGTHRIGVHVKKANNNQMEWRFKTGSDTVYLMMTRTGHKWEDSRNNPSMERN